MNDGGQKFEQLDVGQALDELTLEPNEVQLFMLSAVTWDPHRTQFDTPYSVDKESLPGILVHGHLQGSFLSKYVSDWAGVDGRLRSLNYQNRGMVIPGERLTLRGKLTGKSREDETCVVTMQVWLEKDGGEISTTGEATVEIPYGQ